MFSISLGPISLAVDTALTLLSLIIFALSVHFFSRKSSDRQALNDGAFYAPFIGFVVARLAFVISMWEVYRQDLLSVIDIRDGGFDNQFGWYAGVIVLVWVAHGKRERQRTLLKAAAISLSVMLPLVIAKSIYQAKPEYPTAALTSIDGQKVQLQDYSGKPVVLNFWATWCPPCRREMPVLASAQAQFENVAFVFINQQEPPEKVRQFLSSNQLTLENALMDYTGEIASELGAYGLPTTLFFNAKGQLTDSHLGELSNATLTHYLQRITE